MENHKSKVDIIIVNYNRVKDTIECIESLSQLSYSNYKIVIIDNNSSDSSVRAINDKFSNVRVISSKEIWVIVEVIIWE